jgi:hypothetical protein
MEEKNLHINALEMKAAVIAIRSLTRTKENIHVHLKMDNVTAVTYLNKMGGTKSCTLNTITKEIWEYCLSKKIILTAEYLPGCQNSIADWESRNAQEVSINSWRLNPAIFDQINKILGPIKIDLFADRWNAQVFQYISWKNDPLALSVDAFLTTWEKEKEAYAFPPFCMIPKCLCKIQREGGELVLITPAWQTQSYYPLLLQMAITKPILLPPQTNLLMSPKGGNHPMILNGALKLVAWKISGNPRKCWEFQNKLQSYSPQRGDRVPSQLTTAAGNTGLAGVINNKLIPFVPLWNL